jgi:pSer/pThr/pTyr-binding forkhead associated (FHA) protein
MLKLTVSVDGVDIQQVYLNRTRTTLGRRPDNHIVLPDLAVSGMHCALTFQGLSEVLVEDLGSTNEVTEAGKTTAMHLDDFSKL